MRNMFKQIIVVSTIGLSSLAFGADPAQHNAMSWNNQQPQQQKALEAFYRSMDKNVQIQNQRQIQQPNRQIQAQQLRSMTPNQRQQMFMNYMNQHRSTR